MSVFNAPCVYLYTCMCLQVNHSPSFTTDSQLDCEVKDALLYDTLVLINLGACDRRKIIREERRRVKDRLQQNSSRKARWGLSSRSRSDTQPGPSACVSLPGRRSCVSVRQPRRSRWRGTRPSTWEALRGSTPGREERNTTSISNTAARFSRRRPHPRPGRSVPGTRSTTPSHSVQLNKEQTLQLLGLLGWPRFQNLSRGANAEFCYRVSE